MHKWWWLLILIWLTFPHQVGAVYDPLSVPNNRYGIHILDPDEIQEAAKLVNSNGGEWGYVTVPIRGTDRDRRKWVNFFRLSQELKVIPILRLATFGRGDTWVLPTEDEMLDFANFLSEMPWPVKNRYLIVFNEVNHSKEWGGFVDPDTYAEILTYTSEIFKNRHEDFYILPAAMDMAAPDNHTSISGLNYWRQVFRARPELAKQIDGWNSHAYPNPAFTGSPGDQHQRSLVSYRYELALLKKFGRAEIPVFITETGWDQTAISSEKLTDYWKKAWQDVWVDENLVAVTPFVLQARDGPFAKFSFLGTEQIPSVSYRVILEIPKEAGQPLLTTVSSSRSPVQGLSDFVGDLRPLERVNFNLDQILSRLKELWAKLFIIQKPYIEVNQKQIKLEIADTPEKITLGLGGRQSLPEDEGMLFVFKEKQIPTFWMKNTLFPLDIIWIKDEQVVGVTATIPVAADPTQPTNLYPAPEAVNYVLELNAGGALKYGIKTGDEVKIFR